MIAIRLNLLQANISSYTYLHKYMRVIIVSLYSTTLEDRLDRQAKYEKH